MARRVSLEIVGDSSSLEKAFANASNAARKFNAQIGSSTRQSGIAQLKEQAAVAKGEEKMFKLRARRAASLGPFRLAGIGLGAGTALFAATQAVRELGQSLETTGAEAFTTTGRLKNMVAALTTGDLVGAAKAIGRQAKTMGELGLQPYQVKQMKGGLEQLAYGADQADKSLSGMTLSTTKAVQANQRFAAVTERAGGLTTSQSKAVLEEAAAMERLADMTDRAKDEVAKLGNLFITQSGALVTWKGAVDDLVRAGRGEAVGGTTPAPRKFAMPEAFLSPSQRRELSLIGQEGLDRIPELQDRLRQLQAQLDRGTSTNKQRLTISTNIRNTEAEIAAIYADQAAKQRDIAGQRNQWFDANIGRQLDRVQDLGLRGQLARLKQIAAEVKARLAVTKDATRRLTLEDTLLGILRQQRSVQADIADNIKAANQALKDRADAIKSAVLDRLQARQTDILNKRALADAKEQLRIARQIGGPQGIKGAMRGLQDVQFDMMRARLEAAPATLTPTGRFQLGNVVTINVHGVTDPAAVARQVTEIMKKRSRRTTTQTRPTAAGQTA